MPDSPENLAYRLTQAERAIGDLRGAVREANDRIDRIVLVVLGTFGTLVVFGLSTAITLLVSRR